MKKIFAAFAALLLLSVSFVPVLAGGTRDNNAVGMDITAMNTTDIDMNPVDGSVFANNTMTVINFWATWCGPCLNELPHFQAVHEYYSNTPENDVVIYGCLLEDSTSTIAAAKALCNQNGYTWTHLRRDSVLTDVLLATADSSGSVYIPQTVVVDSNGIVRDHVVGSFSTQAELADWIAGWLETLENEDPNPGVAGDVNGDDTLDVTDALMTLRYAMSLIDALPNAAAADVNNDGTVDVTDALQILRAAMGIITL